MKTNRLLSKVVFCLAILAIISMLTVAVFASSEIHAAVSTYDHGESLIGISASTSGRVNLKFHYSDFGTAEKMIVKITDPAGNFDRTLEYSINDLDDNIVSVPMAPVEMTYKVSVYATSENGNGKPVEYSIRQYAEDVLAREDLADQHDTIRALLNWGAMSQMNFNVATNALASDGIFARNSNPIIAVGSIPFVDAADTSVEGDAISNGTMNLVLGQGDLSLCFYVDYSGESESLSATIKREAGQNGEELNKTVSATKTDDGQYLVRISNIGVTLFDKVYEIKFFDNNGNTFTAQKSVLEYLNYLSLNSESETEQSTVRSLYQFYQLAVGTVNGDGCTHGAEYWIGGEKADTLKCAKCFASLLSSPIPHSVIKYFSANSIAGSFVNYGNCTNSMAVDNEAYAHFVGKTASAQAEIWYKRSTADGGYAAVDAPANIELGDAKYFVIKFRSSDVDNTFNGYFSTTGINGWESIKFPVAENNGWVTYVVDLSTVLPSHYVAVDGKYVVDSLIFRKTAFDPADTLDIAYMAFVADWEEISALTGENTVRQMTSRTAFKIVNTFDGSDATISE